MRSALYFLALLALLGAIACVPSATAFVSNSASKKAAKETMAPEQVAILLNLTTDWPQLQNLSDGMWTSEYLSQEACDNDFSVVVFTCNGSGWVSTLEIDSTQLVGTFPDRIGEMKALERILVSARSTGLTGTLPSSWSQLSKLFSLILYAPTIEGPIPASWSSFARLASLKLAWSPTAPVIAWDSSALPTNLEVLELRGYNFGTSGSFPVELFDDFSVLGSITMLNVTFNGDLSAIWGNHTSTTVSDLTLSMRSGLESSLAATPALPSDMTSVPLSTLSLKNFPILGPLPTNLPSGLTSFSLDNLPKLESTLETGLLADHSERLAVFIQNMPLVTGNVPPIGVNISPVVLNNLGLNGTINSQIFSNIGLQELRVSSMPNMPPQSLPEATADCGLERLSLSSINLQGSVPLSFSQYCAINVLDLSYNGLSGTLPWVGTAEADSVFLQNNSFVGQFPDALALQIMNQLNIENNQFSGTIPRVLLEGRLFAFAVAYNQINICASVNGTDFSAWRPVQCSIAPQTPTVCSCYLQGFGGDTCWRSTDSCSGSPSSSSSPSSTPGSPVGRPTGSAVHSSHSTVLMALVAALVLLVAY